LCFGAVLGAVVLHFQKRRLLLFEGDFRSRQNGNWKDYTTWQIYSSGSWVNASSLQYPNSFTSNVTIRNTVVLDGSPLAVKDLRVNSGNKLWCNANGSPKYISVYGNIICNGTIGNPGVRDDISFNIESASCNISGTGQFSCARIRKSTDDNPVTNLTIDMNVATTWDGSGNTQLYNNSTNGSFFNVTLNAGRTFNCTNGGTVAIDGTSGAGTGNMAGKYTINGTMNIPGTLYLTTNNTNTSYKNAKYLLVMEE